MTSLIIAGLGVAGICGGLGLALLNARVIQLAQQLNKLASLSLDLAEELNKTKARLALIKKGDK